MPVTTTAHANIRALVFEVRSADGTLVTPAFVMLTIWPPTGVAIVHVWGADAGPVEIATGLFRFDLVIAASGVWEVEWRSTNPVQTWRETLRLQVAGVGLIEGG